MECEAHCSASETSAHSAGTRTTGRPAPPPALSKRTWKYTFYLVQQRHFVLQLCCIKAYGNTHSHIYYTLKYYRRCFSPKTDINKFWLYPTYVGFLESSLCTRPLAIRIFSIQSKPPQYWPVQLFIEYYFK